MFGHALRGAIGQVYKMKSLLLYDTFTLHAIVELGSNDLLG
jgi:hypothetical protein